MAISGSSQVLGVFGDPVAHSLSPAMHAAFAAYTGADTVYVPFHVRSNRLGAAVTALPALGIRGVNVTVPHKEAVLPWLDETTAVAERIGAVNTITQDEGHLLGDNTDSPGFIADLRARFSDHDWINRPALVLGAGGAARAVVYALAESGIPELVVANRTQAKAESLVADLAPEIGWSSDLDPARIRQALGRVGLLVNTTSIGLHGEGFAELELAALPRDAAVYDLIYNPPRTPLLQQAEASGLATANGLGMLVWQGALSYAHWTGREPPVEAVRSELAAQMSG